MKVKDYCRGCSILFDLHALIERKNVVDEDVERVVRRCSVALTFDAIVRN